MQVRLERRTGPPPVEDEIERPTIEAELWRALATPAGAGR
jgi:hypothetical protein